MTLEFWFAFVVASAALLLIPGPTVLLILSYAISQVRRVSLAAVAGVALGDLVAMSTSAGLGALVLAFAALFTALKWLGVASYLIYLGVKLFKSASGASYR